MRVSVVSIQRCLQLRLEIRVFLFLFSLGEGEREDERERERKVTCSSISAMSLFCWSERTGGAQPSARALSASLFLNSCRDTLQ